MSKNQFKSHLPLVGTCNSEVLTSVTDRGGSQAPRPAGSCAGWSLGDPEAVEGGEEHRASTSGRRGSARPPGSAGL